RRAIGIGADNLDVRVLLLQVSAHAGKRPARSDSCDKRTDLSFGLFPNFRTSAAIMRVAIRDVIELICPKPAALLCQTARDMIVIFRILVRFFRHCLYLRAERAQQMHFLRRLIIWNHNYRGISPRPSNYGKPDPGVTSGSLNDHGAWLKPTCFLSVGD